MPRKPRNLDDLDWESFFDIASTTEAARAMDSLYGAGAARRCIACALAAEQDNRPEDQRFWTAVLAELGGGAFH